MSSFVRALATPLSLALARARAAPGRWVLAALGIAVAVALLGISAGGGAVAGEQGARATLRALPPGQRDLRVSWNGGLPRGIDARARSTLRSLTPAGQTRSVLLLATKAAPGPVVQMAAITPLRRWVRLSSGRLPRSCTPVRCEVLQLGGARISGALGRSGTALAIVGRGALTSSVPLGFVPRPDAPGTLAQGRQPPLLVTSDPGALDALESFSSVYRTQGWSAPLTLGDRPSWKLDALRTRLEHAASALSATDETFQLAAPVDGLAAARDRASTARRRVLLIGAGAAALLAAFAVLAAGALRRDLAAERARLERRGARGWQLALLTLAEGMWPALAGVVGGAVVAIAVTAVRASAADVPVGDLMTHTFLTPAAILAGVLCWLVAGGLVTLGARAWRPGTGRMIDLFALGAVVALAVGLARGGTRAGDPGDPLPTLLPPLVLLAAGLVIARLVAPLLRGAEGATRSAPLPLRLAVLGLSRAPEGPALTVAVVAVSCGLACFAGAYRATLRHGERDQAAQRVPLDVTIAAGPQFVRPLEAAPAARWRSLAGAGATVLPVLRTSASVPRGATRATVPLLGVPAAGLTQLRGWRRDSASAPVATLARRLRSAASVPLTGPLVRAGDRALTVGVRSVGDGLDLTADLVGSDGSLLAIALGTAGPEARTLTARLPRAAAGHRLVALEAAEPPGLRATRGHQQAENGSAPTATHGMLVFAGARLGARPLDLGTWVGTGPLDDASRAGAAVRARFSFDTSGRALLRPRQATDGRTIPVLVDPASAAGAAKGGVLPLSVDGIEVRGRVVGTVDRFPTVGTGTAGVAVADETALTTVLGAAAPGVARPDELWIHADPAGEAALRAALRRPPLSAVSLSSRRALEARLGDDPLSRELVRTLALAAIVALALGALGVLLAATAALRDDGAELYDLEAAGADPATLRADVRLRAGALAALGLLAGLVVGTGLIALVVDAVQLTATGRAAFPPLVTIVPVGGWAVGAAGFLAACAVAVALATRRAFSGDVARRPPGVAP